MIHARGAGGGMAWHRHLVAIGLAGFVLAAGACGESLPSGTLELKRAAFQGDADQVRKLLATGVDPDGRSPATGTALADAAAGPHREIVRILLAAGANPNLASDSGYTPLIAAASVGADLIVSDLVEAGAEINAADVEYRSTALHIAAGRGHVRVVQRLLQSGADPLLRTSGGLTPRDIARRRGHRDVVDLLLEAEQRRSQ